MSVSSRDTEEGSKDQMKEDAETGRHGDTEMCRRGQLFSPRPRVSPTPRLP
jgi:hypothetical protein